jgi:S-adenosylmethionine decarboxylase proenzyme
MEGMRGGPVVGQVSKGKLRILGGRPALAACSLSCPPMHGLHLTADLRGCRRAAFPDADSLRRHCLQAVADAGLQAVGELFHRFPAPGGVTGVVLLAESHLAVHTWPELGAVTLDVYVCNQQADHSAGALALMAGLEALFEPQQVERHRVQRGGG